MVCSGNHFNQHNVGRFYRLRVFLRSGAARFRSFCFAHDLHLWGGALMACAAWSMVLITFFDTAERPARAAFTATTNVLFGRIYFDDCRSNYVVRWTNVPPACVVEHSFDLTNWHAVLIWSTPTDRPSRSTFEYNATNSNQATFMRLRQIQPIPTPAQ